MSWSAVRRTSNPLWQSGFNFYCSTPKSRHTTQSSWSTVDWNTIWSSNFGDPLRMDRRLPSASDRQIQVNPDAATAIGLQDGDLVWVDANPADRPYVGWTEDDPRYKAFRCQVRIKFNPALPYEFTIMKHTGWMASERTVAAHETRPDGLALAEGTGYQASYRYGSHQSITRGWLPPMHQTDSLFHKSAPAMRYVFGFDEDNHAVNTVPKETLIRLTKVEPGGIGGEEIWEPAATGRSPGNEDERSLSYLSGQLTTVRRRG
jgi:nitrate reductase alpha subunit